MLSNYVFFFPHLRPSFGHKSSLFKFDRIPVMEIC